MELIDWIKDNAIWIFSGIGTTILIAVGGVMLRNKDRKQSNMYQ